MKLSPFGQSLGVATGIGELMDDLGAALADKSQDICMMGGGQPAEIPEISTLFYQQLHSIIESPADLHRILGEYDPAEGEARFRSAFANMMNALYHWDLSVHNIGISAGGQSACFHLFNALVGPGEHIMIPLLPDYMGYRDQLVSGASFLGIMGIASHEGNRFKYTLDREAISNAPDSVKLIALSRPTNPSGNVLTDDEVLFLSDEARRRNIPILIDHAYGAPFPNALFVNNQNIWAPHHIHLYSLSKLGLPSTRTSILVAHPEIVHLMRNMTAVTSLSNPGLGQALILPLIKDQSLPDIAHQIIQPYYRQKRDFAIHTLDSLLAGNLDYALHQAEGAFFLWLYLPSLPISSQQLVERLKERGLLAISGHWFFFGNEQLPSHSQKCLRLTYSMPEQEVQKGLVILAETLIELHSSEA